MTVRPLIDGWVQTAAGVPVLLSSTDEYADDDPLVVHRPDLFTKPRGRKTAETPPAKSTKAK